MRSARSIPAAERGQVNCSARRRALRRRCGSGLLSTEATAWAMARGSLSAVAPLSSVRISASADVRDTTAGVPQARASSAANPNVSCGPGRQRDVRARQDARHGVAAADVSGEVDRQPARLALQPGPQRALPDHDQARVDAGIAQRGNRVDTALRMLFHRQPAAVHQQQLAGTGPAVADRGRAAGRGGTGRDRPPAEQSGRSSRRCGRTRRGRTRWCTPPCRSWRRCDGWRCRPPTWPAAAAASG